MTATFPPLPWTEGDTFVNDTTNVTYVFNGKAWVSAGSPGDPQVDYLPLSGGTLTGQLLMGVGGQAFAIIDQKGASLFTAFTGNYSQDCQYYKQAKDYGNSKLEIANGFYVEQYCQDNYVPSAGGEFTGDVKFKDAAKLQMGGTYNNKIIDGSVGFTDNGHVATLGYVKHQINALGDSLQGDQIPSTCRKLRFARDKDWNNIRPGEFGLMDKNNNYVGKWSEASQIFFTGADSDGNRLIKDENMKDWQSYLGSALTVLTSSGERPVLRAVPTGQAGGFVMLEYTKDIDIFYIGWTESKCAAVMTGTNDNLSNAQYFLFNIPDLFFS